MRLPLGVGVGRAYVEGPVELRVDGQEPVLIERFTVAICACRRSRRYPLCDNSHVEGDSVGLEL
jgi:CDGSH-type Zn-finger protein